MIQESCHTCERRRLQNLIVVYVNELLPGTPPKISSKYTNPKNTLLFVIIPSSSLCHKITSANSKMHGHQLQSNRGRCEATLCWAARSYASILLFVEENSSVNSTF